MAKGFPQKYGRIIPPVQSMPQYANRISPAGESSNCGRWPIIVDMTTALLVIDAQTHLFTSEPVFESERTGRTLQGLVERARDAQAPVLFIRHDGGQGAADERGTPGWEILADLQPDAGTVTIDKDSDNAFLRTGLAAWLLQNGIGRLVICGMLTEYCVDSTVRAAHDLGYSVILVADGHSTHDSETLSAAQIIAHHNTVLSGFAEVKPAAEVDFASAAATLKISGLTAGDVAAIQAGLVEWQHYERWLAHGDARPYWPHTHPALVSDTLHQLWEPEFKLRGRYTDPPPWEMGIARTFIQPLLDTPMFVRKQAVQAVTKAFDHLLQNPRNPLSPHINHLGDDLYSYDARDIRLFYVPHVTTDVNGRERRYIFLLWAAPGVPERNPFAF